MRRGAILVLCLLAVCAVLAPEASAQSRDLPGAIIGIITRPLGAILGAPSRFGRRANHHKPTASKSGPARRSRGTGESDGHSRHRGRHRRSGSSRGGFIGRAGRNRNDANSHPRAGTAQRRADSTGR